MAQIGPFLPFEAPVSHLTIDSGCENVAEGGSRPISHSPGVLGKIVETSLEII